MGSLRSVQRGVATLAGLALATGMAFASQSAYAAPPLLPSSGPTDGGTTVMVPGPPPPLTRVFTSAYHTLALDASGNLYAWGYNGAGESGNGTPSPPLLTPTRSINPAGVKLTQVSAGYSYSLALGENGKIYGWGQNDLGQLGIGVTGPNVATPTAIVSPPGVLFSRVVAGPSSAVAVSTDGRLFTWGANQSGELGNGTTNHSPFPTAVATPPELEFTYADSRGATVMALTSTGLAYGFGVGLSGELGNGTESSSLVPVPVTMPAGVLFESISSASYHTLAQGSDGKLYAWGNNDAGQIGNGTTTAALRPTPVDTPSGVAFTQVSAGKKVSTAIGSDGNTYTWGEGASGEMGNGSTANILRPSAVPLPSGVHFTRVTTGGAQVFAEGSDGYNYAWGGNWGGQLGLGDLNDRLSPVQLPNSTQVTSITFDGVEALTGAHTAHNMWESVTPPHPGAVVDVVMTFTQLGSTHSLRYPNSFIYGSAPKITQHPASQIVPTGSSVTVSAAAAGDEFPRVQWETSVDAGVTWTPVPGATSPKYTFIFHSSQSGIQFRARFSNSHPVSAVSEPATVSLPEAVKPPTDGNESAGSVMPGGTLPATGSEASVMLLSAASVLTIGGIVVLSRRRLRSGLTRR